MMSLEEMKAMFDAINASSDVWDAGVRPYTDVDYYAEQIMVIWDTFSITDPVAKMLAGELLKLEEAKS